MPENCKTILFGFDGYRLESWRLDEMFLNTLWNACSALSMGARRTMEA